MTTQSFVSFRKKYTLKESIQTNISEEYLQDSGSNWGIFEMFRESFQNLLDEAQYMSETEGGEIWDHYSYKKDYWRKHSTKHHIFRDKGRGVNIEKVLLLGVSGKRNTHYRGEKGEGELMSFLVAAQHGIRKYMFSQNWAVTCELTSYLYSEYKVLTINVYETTSNIDGTIWVYESELDLDYYISNRDDYFMGISKRSVGKQKTEKYRRYEESEKEYKKNQRRKKAEQRKKSTSSTKLVMMPRNGQSRLYVKGIYVREIDTIFSYNLQNAAINRDRSMVDDFSLFEGIEKALQSEDVTKKMAEHFWRASQLHTNKLEYRKTYDFGDNAELFNKAFYKVFGKKACIATETFMQTEAKAIGFEPIHLDNAVAEMAEQCGILTDKATSGFLGGYKEVEPTKKEADLLEKLYFIGYQLNLPDVPVVVASKIANVDDTVLGICVDSYGKVVMMRKVFSNKKELLKTYIHEKIHCQTYAGDGTRAFTAGFENLIFELLTTENETLKKLVKEFMNS